MLKNYIENKNLIVVDVQPEYEKFIKFDVIDFCHFLNEQNKILYLYNGESMAMDSKHDLISFLFEKGLNKKIFKNITFIDKGYGFLRSWMDMYIDEDIIIDVLRYMDKNNIQDSRDIDDEILEKFLDEDDYNRVKEDPIYFPDIDVNILRRWNNSFIIGGGQNECLLEIEILLEAFRIKTKRINRFIY